MKTAATAKLFGTDTLQGLTAAFLDKTWAISDQIKHHFTPLTPIFMSKTEGKIKSSGEIGGKQVNYQAAC
ncbi:hypothetical protein [Aeromonas veronii]|uniref:hypothetical protein n=1 Tax=Aeromonas veronii TaxID=654 RepID=UPI00211D9E66|nr:hypothetical protein [Aeromonas veronii]UUM71119.1 hypothetical protein NQU90_03995 [Aeromonas veronii]